jgi:hypothetical protein
MGYPSTGAPAPIAAQPGAGTQPTTAIQPGTGTQPAAITASAGAPSIRITIDTPTAGATVANGANTQIGGWAVDTVGGAGAIDEVRIYLDGLMDAGGTLIGTADYGESRPDVATSIGSSAFTKSGFDFAYSPATLTGGTHVIYVYAHSTANGWAYTSVNVAGAGPAPGTSAYSGTGWGGQAAAGPGATGPMTPYGGSYLPNGGPGGGYAPGAFPGGCAVDYVDFRTPACQGSIGYGSPPGVQQGYPPHPGQACIMIYPPAPSCGGLSTGYPPPYSAAGYPPYGYPRPSFNGLGPAIP